MRRRLTIQFWTYALLAIAAGTSFLLPETLTVPATCAMSPPETATLVGIVRDFTKSHPDFDVTPVLGPGHYAGEVQAWLPGHRRPIHTPATAFKVDVEWRDAASREIAPSQAGVIGLIQPAETLGIRVAGSVEVKKDCQIDSFDSSRGLYGVSGNFGNAAFVSTNSTSGDAIEVDSNGSIFGDVSCGPGGDPGVVISGAGIITGTKSALAAAHEMPAVTVPTDLAGSLGDVTIAAASVTWTGDLDPDDGSEEPAMNVDDLVIQNASEVRVEGHLRVVCDTLKIEKDSTVRLDPGASLTFYVTDPSHDVTIKDGVQINVAGPGDADPDTSLVTINLLGDKKVKVEKSSSVYATIVATLGELEIKDGSAVHGAFIGDGLKLDKQSHFHVDTVNGDMGLDNAAVLVRKEIDLKSVGVVDGWDSSVGPYDGPDDGGTNWHDQALLQNLVASKGKVKVDDTEVQGNVLVGPGADPAAVVEVKGGGSITGYTGTMSEAMPIPVIPAPVMGVAYSGDVEYKDGTFTLSTDLHCKKFKMEKAILEIDGEVMIRADGKGQIKKESEIRLLPGATLTFYTSSLKIEDQCRINMINGIAPDVSIRRMSLGKGKGKIEIKKESEVCAWIMGAKTELKLGGESSFYGSFVGDKLSVKGKGKSGIHVDTAYLRTCTSINDTDGAAGLAGTSGIHTAATYDEWYRDILGVNQSTTYPITLVKTAGVWEYINPSFTPIDDALLGNEGEAHNNHFTYTLAAEFTYAECGGQFFEFQGGDGAWLYIDGQLVLDLGGVQASMPQYVDVDRLGLVDGETYAFRLFYAQRTAASKTFALRTNIDLDSDPYAPSILSIFD